MRLQRRLEELTGNLRRIFVVNRNLGFFTTGYNWLIQIIPALIVAPSFIAGEVEFGVITQSAMAFSMLLGAFSLIVTQFPSIPPSPPWSRGSTPWWRLSSKRHRPQGP